MRNILNYITKDEYGTKVWSAIYTFTGTIFGIVIGLMYLNPEQNFIQNYLPMFSIPVGFLCVYLLGIRNNIGNVLGFIANINEVIINLSFGNFGFVFSAIYYGISHIIGYFDWRTNKDSNNKVVVRDINNNKDKYFLITMIIFSTLITYVSYLKGWIGSDMSIIVFVANILVMYLGLLAQGSMIARYRYSWWLWFILNIIAIPLQFITGNFVYALMYIFYQLNVVLALYAQYSKGDNENEL